MIRVLIFTPLQLFRYAKGCELVGLSPTLTDKIEGLDKYDGLLLPGGEDIDPSLYGQNNIACEGVDRKYDEDSITVFNFFLSHNKPILGICKGMQLINVALGGTLLQDIKNHKDSSKQDVHKVKQICENKLSLLYNKTFLVNSIHHQAIDKLGLGLKTTYMAEDGIIEAVEHKSKQIIAVQWHPERLIEEANQEGLKVFKIYKNMFNI